MNTHISTELKEVMEAVHYRPAVSIILPFEAKISLKTEVAHALKVAADKAGTEVMSNYPGELGRIVMQKITNIISGLNYDTGKKGIAVYVSPVFEKVLYLDVPAEAKIIIDESFEIRDLLYSNQQQYKYLALVLSSGESKLFLCNNTIIEKIAGSKAENVELPENDLPERVANFSTPGDRKEIQLEKFIRHVDQTLEAALNSNPFPVFVMGVERVTGHFRQITKHSNAVIDYINGSCEDLSISQLREKLAPAVSVWKSKQQKELLFQLEEAAGKKRLAAGIADVWKEALHQKGRLLVVEKNYLHPAQHSDVEDRITELSEPHNSFSSIRDAVDDVIEKVLQNGGDVEFVDDGALKKYRRIALIRYF